MTGRLNWRKARLLGKPKMSMCGEQGLHPRWLEDAEKRAAEKKRVEIRRKRRRAVRRLHKPPLSSEKYWLSGAKAVGPPVQSPQRMSRAPFRPEYLRH